MNTTKNIARIAGSALLAAGLASSMGVWARQGTAQRGHGGGGGGHAGHSGGGGHAGGGGHHAGATAYRGGTAVRPAPGRAHGTASGVAGYGHGTASGVAHYGHGYGYPYYGYGWYGYPYYWGGWYPWWGAGWYGAWYWDGYGYPGYGPSYTYDESGAPSPQGPATVETDVSPSKAEVVLDGESVGFASDYNGRWDELSVAPGPHTITFRSKGYRSLVVDFEARPGATYTFNDTLAPGDGEERRTLAQQAPAAPHETPANDSAPAATGRLRIHAEPGDSAVYLDGEYLGLGADLSRIHGSLAVGIGTHRLEVVRPGFASAVRTIDVDGAGPATVELRLEPQR
jgi:hypothetical protein